MRPIDAKKGEIKKSLLIAQEIKMARLLTNNDKRIRDKVLKRLKKWLTVRSQSSFGKSVCLHNILLNYTLYDLCANRLKYKYLIF